jgi:ubiquinone/menaquinone biosynthesis C-methylase UbiE
MLKSDTYADKQSEMVRYDERAKQVTIAMSLEGGKAPSGLGVDSIPLYLRSPYEYYEHQLNRCLNAKSSVLEIGSGLGKHTGVLLASGAQVVAMDISSRSLEVLVKSFANPVNLQTVVADMEVLPFDDESFDLVVSAGSLSYGDNLKVLSEIKRVLKPGGGFICVDSLNHNWIYCFNRWLHYIRGNRTLSTLKRMPTIKTIDMYRMAFGEIDVKYFGVISWLSPFVGKVFGEVFSRNLSDAVDRIVRVKRFAFKFVMTAYKIKQ